MERRQTIGELTERIVQEMERMQYSPLTIKGFRNHARRLAEYALQETGEEFFSEALGAKYLRATINFPFEIPRPLTGTEANHVRCVRGIGEYQLYGALLRTKNHQKTEIDWALGDFQAVSAYVKSVQTADNSEATRRLRIHHIRVFYEFLACRRVNGIQALSAEIVSAYAKSLQGGSPVYTKHLLATLRYYFRFLHRDGFTKQDWSFSVPKVMAPKNTNVPALWQRSDVEHLLESIDRGNPVGKRNYAIILLVAQLGVRISDVAELRLESLRWESKELKVVQHKTGNLIVLPLLENVGWAIIDYLQHGRPNVDEPYVFLTSKAPYTKLEPTSVTCILDRQRQRCGIPKRAGTAGGMHSLRHALARRLLEAGTPLSEVADIMGHTSFSSTSPYLKVDIEGLRTCALSLGEEMADA